MSTRSLVEGHREEHLLGVARDMVIRKTKDSKVLDEEAEKRIPKFHQSEFTLGKVLGRGGFCVVNEIVRITLKNNQEGSTTNNNNNNNEEKHPVATDEAQINSVVQDRSFMATHCIRQGKDYRYAVKIMQDSCRKEASLFVNGVVDLAIEARFLSVIRHANIIKMRAMSSGSPYDSNFFVILDRLYDTLTVRMQKWKKGRVTGIKKLLDRNGQKAMAFFMERITVAYDLSCALRYMHELHVIYRDIKPDNIGFDVRGDVKIFDFGLAREFDPLKRDDDGLFHFTADTGSPRYMAPEVALGQPYDERVDVYSFCILAWQMLALEMPFEGFTMNNMKRSVFEGGARPKPDDKNWPDGVCRMLRAGWCNVSDRLSMAQMHTALRNEINSYSEDGVVDNVDASGKSVASLRNTM